MINENDKNTASSQICGGANSVYPEHVAQELKRIAERLRAPDPNQHAGLYAAQQALCWAAQPEAYASPCDAIAGSAEG